MDSIVRPMMFLSELKPGDRYDVNLLEEERQRISDLLRNRGYYFFQPDYIEFLVDTTAGYKLADVRIAPKQGIPDNALRPYTLQNVKVVLARTMPCALIRCRMWRSSWQGTTGRADAIRS